MLLLSAIKDAVNISKHFLAFWSKLQKLLESLEIHMIHDVQKKINKEITLVISEKAREERNLPTGNNHSFLVSSSYLLFQSLVLKKEVRWE